MKRLPLCALLLFGTCGFAPVAQAQDDAGQAPPRGSRWKEGPRLTYVATENCIRCKFTDCVEVCPVD